MQINDKKKICIVATSLAKGGAERSVANLSQLLYNLGHEIYIITILSGVDFKFSGELFDLGKYKVEDASVFNKIKRIQLFRNYLKKYRFDFIIDSRPRNVLIREIFISKWIYRNTKIIYLVHSNNLSTYFVKPDWISELLYKNAFKIVAVSKTIAQKIEDQYGFKNVCNIYNSNTTDEIIGNTPFKEKYILFFGRIDNSVKNLSLLIDAYRLSNLNKKNIFLYIMGEGPDKEDLESRVFEQELNAHIQFLPYNPDPTAIVSNAQFSILTSQYEGLPMVLIESLNLSTPVISVDYDSGVEEIITHEFNGLVVKNNSPSALADAMNRFVNDKNLYLHCKNNAKSSAQKFSMDIISSDWQDLLNKK